MCLTDTSLQTSAAGGKKHDELESMPNPAKPKKMSMFNAVFGPFVSERKRVCIGIIPD